MKAVPISSDIYDITVRRLLVKGINSQDISLSINTRWKNTVTVVKPSFKDWRQMAVCLFAPLSSLEPDSFDTPQTRFTLGGQVCFVAFLTIYYAEELTTVFHAYDSVLDICATPSCSNSMGAIQFRSYASWFNYCFKDSGFVDLAPLKTTSCVPRSENKTSSWQRHQITGAAMQVFVDETWNYCLLSKRRCQQGTRA